MGDQAQNAGPLRVTSAGIANLTAALPNCEIEGP
jgi:hypothetical protein